MFQGARELFYGKGSRMTLRFHIEPSSLHVKDDVLHFLRLYPCMLTPHMTVLWTSLLLVLLVLCISRGVTRVRLSRTNCCNMPWEYTITSLWHGQRGAVVPLK